MTAQKENQLSDWAGLEECMRIFTWSISSSVWTYITVTSEDQQQTQVDLGKWVWTLVRTCLDPSRQGQPCWRKSGLLTPPPTHCVSPPAPDCQDHIAPCPVVALTPNCAGKQEGQQLLFPSDSRGPER